MTHLKTKNNEEIFDTVKSPKFETPFLEILTYSRFYWITFSSLWDVGKGTYINRNHGVTPRANEPDEKLPECVYRGLRAWIDVDYVRNVRNESFMSFPILYILLRKQIFASLVICKIIQSNVLGARGFISNYQKFDWLGTVEINIRIYSKI